MNLLPPPVTDPPERLRALASATRAAATPLFGPASTGEPGGDTEAHHNFSHGLAWNTFAKVSTRAIQFVVTIILARLLVPADFGLAEMAAIVTMLVGMIAEFGFAHALIQKPDVTSADLRTAMTLSVTLAIVLVAVGVAASGAIAALLREPSLQAPLSVACLGMLVAAVGITPRALLMRRFDFRSIAVADFAGCVGYGVAGIALALNGAGVWSLVLASLAMIVGQTLVVAVRSKCPYRPLIDMDSARAIVPFGAKVFAANVLTYVRSNLDYVVIGRALGAAPLGVYAIAFRVADFPRNRMANTVMEVALPAMSSVQEQRENLKRAYSRAVATTTLLTFPLLVGAAALAPEFISVVYGEKWMGGVAPLRILLPMAMLLLVSQQTVSVLVAIGEPGRYLKLGVSYAVEVGVGALVGVRWGITGVAAGVLVATVIYAVSTAVVMYRIAGISPRLTLKSLYVPSLSSAVMVAAVQLYRTFVPFPEGAAGVVWLLGASAAGAAVYAAVALGMGSFIGKDAARAARLWAVEGERAAEPTA